MTDGVLLAEIHRDRELRRYDTIILDEAHERSLTIDFLLGYLKQLLPRRPDLKLIITSATIDPESFSRHFAASDGTPAPIVEVSGRTYPVEIRYRPLVSEHGARRRRGRRQRRPRLPPGHHRRARRAGARGVGRRAGVPLRRERDPGCRGRRARRVRPRDRGGPALRATEFGRAAPRVRDQARPRHPAPRRAGDERRRDEPHGARHQVRGGCRHRPHLALQRRARRCSGCRSRRSARRARTSDPVARDARATGSRSGCTRRRTSPDAPSSPTPRSCAPTWPRSSCR